jgi:hypothetical protein
VMRGSTFTESNYGIVLNESSRSVGYKMDADLTANGDPSWITGDFVQDLVLAGCNDDVPAEGNYFGTPDPAKVEAKITHKYDDPKLGLVDYSQLVDDSCELRVRGHFEFGYRITLALKGPAGDTYAFFASPNQGNVPTPYGPFLLDPTNFMVMRAGTIGSRGMYLFSAQISAEVPPGTPYYFQGFVGSGTSGKLSNLQSLVTP